jgi:hypothetical protein
VKEHGFSHDQIQLCKISAAGSNVGGGSSLKGGRQLRLRKRGDPIRTPFDDHLVFIIEHDDSLSFNLAQDPNLIHVHVNSLSTRHLESNKSRHVSLRYMFARPSIGDSRAHQ